MTKKIIITKSLDKRRCNILHSLKIIKKNNKALFNRLLELIPSWVLDMLENTTINIDRLKEFEECNKKYIDRIRDVRSTEQVVFNYYICLISELIAEAYIEQVGFCVKRNSIDKDISDNKHTLSTKADLSFLHNNEWHNIEVQFADFSYNNIKIKKYKADKNLEDNEDVKMMIISFNKEKQAVEYITFKLKKYIKKALLIKNDVFMGGKDTYLIKLDNFKIKRIA